MDERLPVEKALGIGEGDAHIFRNAGGLVTDDAIRSAMLTTQFFGTKEIMATSGKWKLGGYVVPMNV